MSFIGQLERFFGEVIFPLRVPIAITLIAAFIGLIVIARRRRWGRVVRRHPRLSTALTAVVLGVVVPAGWYLGSPLVVRTQLEEPPAAGAAARETEAPPSPAASAILAGEFTGADEFHFGRGRALLIDDGDGTYTLRFEEFSVLNGPDLRVYLSAIDGYSAEATEVGPLRATDGSFNYDIGAIDPGTVRSVLIWCEPFGVLFASAVLTGS